ncbi:DUF4179 domain-containing protein [Anaeromicrobium sediminis]|uniref:DUF4179 domain-containing protein n=1 Tax=Anaeromicrobium sediminis TaxID=1478221 RepID=A0A267MJJ8_9FIRM|nr:DUF4179 domain-containing protein [Anaeromicrobium sediminis]PAB59627.1 hypothetical protein CCE28_08645 [Anaeromicrobium sediminis]
MDKNSLTDLKKEYEEIEIPSELNNMVQIGVERGRAEMNKHNRNRRRKEIMKVCASFTVALTLFTAGVNMSPAFADSLKNIPIVGKLVKVLQFNNGKSGGGSITDRTDISAIESFEKEGYENIIINFSQDGQLQENVGAFKVRYDENPYTMTFEIGGARRISAKENFEKILENKYVKDIYTIITLDDSLIRFVIEFEGPVEYKVKEMKDPASIIIGLKKDKNYEEKKTYSLRTESYPNGETLGILEEEFMPNNETRILKDENGLFFVEIQSFETKKEAENKLEELSKLTDKVILIEERIGIKEPESYPVEGINNEINNKNSKELNSNDDSFKGLSLYPVSIYEDDNQYYGNLEILEKGLNIYNEDTKEKVVHYLEYENIKLTKLLGEASYNLEIKYDHKTIIISGLYSDFFKELDKHTEVKE